MHRDFPHVHEDDDHVHELEEQHPLWKMDRIVLHSVGIDIGSSTSHLVFSTLEMRRQSAALSSRYELSRREVPFRSRILLTPFVAGTSIDTEALSAFIREAYSESGFAVDEIDTGAVITTGDAARKDNAAAVVRIFAEQAGTFVCASAGPLLEAKMAAYGSGAIALSAEAGETVLNVDVGGGTAKLVIARDGKIITAAATNVGARLVTFDDAGVVTKIEQAAAIVARHLGISLEVGKPIDEKTRRQLSAALADALMQVAARKPLSPLAAELMISPPLSYDGKVDAVMFSGGVSEYVYGTESTSFGDLGILLGADINALLDRFLPDIRLETPAEGIRATVIGASQFTAQVSGNTIHIGDAKLLPLRNLRVVGMDFTETECDQRHIADAIRRALEISETAEDEPFALALHWPHGPAFANIQTLCAGIAEALSKRVERREPIVLALDLDIARLVGANLSEMLGGYEKIICIDGIELQDFDYIDISEERAESRVVTVVIKSLVFSG